VNRMRSDEPLTVTMHIFRRFERVDVGVLGLSRRTFQRRGKTFSLSCLFSTIRTPFFVRNRYPQTYSDAQLSASVALQRPMTPARHFLMTEG
jgi:hypothetical protein